MVGVRTVYRGTSIVLGAIGSHVPRPILRRREWANSTQRERVAPANGVSFPIDLDLSGAPRLALCRGVAGCSEGTIVRRWEQACYSVDTLRRVAQAM